MTGVFVDGKYGSYHDHGTLARICHGQLRTHHMYSPPNDSNQPTRQEIVLIFGLTVSLLPFYIVMLTNLANVQNKFPAMGMFPEK